MSENSYLKLKRDLEELQDAFDNETNDQTASEIQKHIVEVSALLEKEDYDLSIDDLFKCSCCKSILDIEDSVQVGHALYCEDCA